LPGRIVAGLVALSLSADCSWATGDGQGAAAVGLCLDLQAVSSVVEQGAPIEVEVRLRNCGASYVVVPPRLFPQPSGEEPEPWGVLTFLIQHGEGPPARYVGSWDGSKLKLPSPADFLILGPGYFYGLRLSLTEGPFAYAIVYPGPLQITAELQTAAKQWLESRPEPVPFDLNRVFSGTVRSDQVAICER
jgi:hypothetical protein